MRKRSLFFLILVLVASGNLFAHARATNESGSKVSTLAPSSILFGEENEYIWAETNEMRIEFYKESEGYNRLYDSEGSVLVYDDRMTVEYYRPQGGGSWNQRGIPYNLTWIQRDNVYEVTRHFTDYIGTNYNITYLIDGSEKIKITISLISGQTDIYRIHWAPSGITNNLWNKSDHRIIFGEFDNDGISFDWEDVYRELGNITDYEISSNAQGRKLDIFFGIGSISEGEKRIIDPSIVTENVLSTLAVSGTTSRITYFAAGRHWVWYCEGGNQGVNFTSSTDGINWDAPTEFTNANVNFGHFLSVWFNGSKVHIVWSTQGFTSPTFFRQGTPLANGSIDWDTDVQLLLSGGGGDFFRQRYIVRVDSEGYPWVAYYEQNRTGAPTVYSTVITKSSSNNGTWITEGGFPQIVSDISSPFAKPTLEQIPSGEMAVFWATASSLNVRVWNGTDLETKIVMGGNINSYDFVSMADENIIHIGYIDSDEDLAYDNFNSTSDSWEGQTTLVPYTVNDAVLPSLTLNGKEIYYFWINETSDFIHYKIFNGTWGATINWLNETIDTLPQADSFASFDQTRNFMIGVAYVTGQASPWNVSYAFLSIPGAAVIVSNEGLISNQTEVDALEFFALNVTISIIPDIGNFSRNTLTLDPESLAIKITYLNGTGFSELDDPLDYISLDIGSSSKYDINLTSFNLTYVLFVRPSITREGLFNVTSFSNETGGVSATDLFQDIFNLTIRNPPEPALLFGTGFNASTPIVFLRWNITSPLITDFEIQNSSDGVAFTVLGTSSDQNYSDTAIKNGTYRYYRVRSRRSTGVGLKNSTFSNINLEQVYFIRAGVAGPGAPGQNVSGIWIDYNATSINASVGIIDAGNVASTFFIDGDMFNVSEVVGVPGQLISINFTGVDPDAECLWVTIWYMYDGNLNHDFDIEMWNFTSSAWVDDGHLFDGVVFSWANSTIYGLRIPLEFLSGGEVRVQLNHESPGNMNHDLFIDQVRLVARIPSGPTPGAQIINIVESDFPWIAIAIILMLVAYLLFSRLI